MKTNILIGLCISVMVVCIAFSMFPLPHSFLFIGNPNKMKVEYFHFVDCTGQRQTINDFVLQCARNANPMSDEEGEDLVKECRETAIQLNCPISIREVHVYRDKCIIPPDRLTSCSETSQQYSKGGTLRIGELLVEIN